MNPYLHGGSSFTASATVFQPQLDGENWGLRLYKDFNDAYGHTFRFIAFQTDQFNERPDVFSFPEKVHYEPGVPCKQLRSDDDVLITITRNASNGTMEISKIDDMQHNALLVVIKPKNPTAAIRKFVVAKAWFQENGL